MDERGGGIMHAAIGSLEDRQQLRGMIGLDRIARAMNAFDAGAHGPGAAAIHPVNASTLGVGAFGFYQALPIREETVGIIPGVLLVEVTPDEHHGRIAGQGRQTGDLLPTPGGIAFPRTIEVDSGHPDFAGGAGKTKGGVTVQRMEGPAAREAGRKQGVPLPLDPIGVPYFRIPALAQFCRQMPSERGFLVGGVVGLEGEQDIGLQSADPAEDGIALGPGALVGIPE